MINGTAALGTGRKGGEGFRHGLRGKTWKTCNGHCQTGESTLAFLEGFGT